MKYADAEKYIGDLNNRRVAGFNDWRLPTLEEAMSLMESKKINSDLYLDPVFGKHKKWIWTADKVRTGLEWFVDFANGCCRHNTDGGNTDDWMRMLPYQT